MLDDITQSWWTVKHAFFDRWGTVVISIKHSWRTVMDAIMDGWELCWIVSRTVGELSWMLSCMDGELCWIVVADLCWRVSSTVVQTTSDVSWALSISPVGTFNSRSSSLMSSLSLASGTTTDLGGCPNTSSNGVCFVELCTLSIDCIWIIIIITIHTV